MAKYLITGGAGFIGSHLAKRLLELGQNVVIFDNFSTGRPENVEGIEVVRGDIRDMGAIQKATKGVDYVSHHAAQISVPKSIEEPFETMEINDKGTLNMLIAAQENGVKKITFSSSCAVYGDTKNLPITENEPVKPLSPYAVSKLVGEYYLQVFAHLYGIEVTIFRYFNVYGDGQDPNSPYAAAIPIFKKLAEEKKPLKIFGDGSQTRDFIHVSDVVEANIKAFNLKTDASPINIGTGTAITIKQLALTISSDVQYAQEREGDIKHSVANVSRAKKILQLVAKEKIHKNS